MDVTFTAQMEEELDRIEEGKLLFRTALENFYLPSPKSWRRQRES